MLQLRFLADSSVDVKKLEVKSVLGAFTFLASVEDAAHLISIPLWKNITKDSLAIMKICHGGNLEQFGETLVEEILAYKVGVQKRSEETSLDEAALVQHASLPQLLKFVHPKIPRSESAAHRILDLVAVNQRKAAPEKQGPEESKKEATEPMAKIPPDVPTLVVGQHVITTAAKRKQAFDQKKAEIVSVLSKKVRVCMLEGEEKGSMKEFLHSAIRLVEPKPVAVPQSGQKPEEENPLQKILGNTENLL